MGCPAKKVCGRSCGSALLADETLVASILETVVRAVEVPVTLKIRTGWDPEHRNGVKIACIAERCGIAALAVHGVGVPAAQNAPLPRNPWDQADGFTPNRPAAIPFSFASGTLEHRVTVEYRGALACAARVGAGPPLILAAVSRDTATVAAEIDGVRRHARYLATSGRLHLWAAGAHYELLLDDPRTHQFAASAASGGLTTPLPGVVVAVPVSVGQQVAAGEVLMVIEAMKMEHTITAPYAGTVESVHFARGDRVPEGSELLSFTREPASGAAPG